ncbi:hypothetical protein POM88_000276 [Heracleum sosnowskyi]|uniref:Uncharacterized protein n=1 Tax=Heracleum sosnowskyi TaxID=360622 RepID=A0AAD8JBH5_9APIA|nr:hypothetical protein POM88_000276 [Heracleum sosnowskyi]
MKEVRGPSYRPPKFENVDLGDKAKTPVSTIAEHDIIEITQPSQHVSQTPTLASQPSSSRPEKLDVRRLRDRKWQINKPLSESKKEDIKSIWGWGSDGEVKMKEGIVHKSFHLSAKAMLSLAPDPLCDDAEYPAEERVMVGLLANMLRYLDRNAMKFPKEAPKWEDEDMEIFRYRIAKELQQGKARRIPGFLMR